jgi:hypothetical protein
VRCIGAGGIALLAILLMGCASSGQGTAAAGATDDTVVQWIDLTNTAGEPVTVSARVGAGAEQPLGFFGPAEYRRVRVSTGADPTGEIFLSARNNQTGNQATTRLKVTPGQTLRWDIKF